MRMTSLSAAILASAVLAPNTNATAQIATIEAVLATAIGEVTCSRTCTEIGTPQGLDAVVEKLKAGEAVRIVCFGDSVTGVYYHTGGRRAYTDMLGIALRKLYPHTDLTMINAGISGHTTVNALDRIDRDVLALKPTLVTVMFGLNDMTRVPVEKYRANLGTIIDKCRAAGAEVLLCTPNNVLSTAGRTSETLEKYCEIVREVGRAKNVAVCDCYIALQALRDRDALGWRLLMSDEIHPNMDGHKRLAELIARSIADRDVSLADVLPSAPALARTLSRIQAKQHVNILAMPPYDVLVGKALRQIAPQAELDITPWPTENKTLRELEQDANRRVRLMKPDLVLIAVPRSAAADSTESFIRSYAWIMNWSLSFGTQEWDCVVVHPSVAVPEQNAAERDDLVRQLVRAQDLTLIDRDGADHSTAREIFDRWLAAQLQPLQ